MATPITSKTIGRTSALGSSIKRFNAPSLEMIDREKKKILPKIFKKILDKYPGMCYTIIILKERRKQNMTHDYWELHDAEWEELQALLREED